MLSVGLTGGIGSGKSTAARLLADRGALVIDADQLAREVVSPGQKGLRRIVDAFGSAVLDRTGLLDRDALAAIVFSDPAKRRLLDSLLHPLIVDRLFARIGQLHATGYSGIVIADIPLLFECGLGDRFDVLLLVYADARTQLERMMLRNGLSREAAAGRLEAQMPIEQKRQLSHYIIDNCATMAELEAGVEGAWKFLREILIKKQ